MAIAKQYVDLMRGKIEVSSRQGVGLAFTQKSTAYSRTCTN